MNEINKIHELCKCINRYVFIALVGASVVFLSGCEGEGGTSADSATGSTESGNTTGRGGSTARMTIGGDYLYAIAGSEVQLFDISQPEAPNPWAKVNVAWDIETLFPYGEYLLIGAASGMHIMDNTDPASPQYLTGFSHAQARDPIVAYEGYAYITLSSDGFGLANQMDVVDIRDISNPRAVESIGMQGPTGLAVAVNEGAPADLYVCDDVAGIKIFDLSNPEAVTVESAVQNVNCNDVIAVGGILYVITDDALLQYDYTSTPPVLLSEVRETDS